MLAISKKGCKFAASNNKEKSNQLKLTTMKKTMTTSEVAQMVMEMFPPTSKYTPNETAVYDEDGNSVINVKEMESGCSKVFGFPCNWKTYGQLKAAEKKAMVDYIKSIKVDIVTNVHYDGFETKQYYLAGTYENFKEKRSYVKEYEIKPYNY